MASEEDFSSEEFVDELKEKEIKKQREEERKEFFKRNSYLKDTLISEIIKKTSEVEEKHKKEFSSEDYFEKLKDDQIKEGEEED